jgi:hypothetical protein
MFVMMLLLVQMYGLILGMVRGGSQLMLILHISLSRVEVEVGMIILVVVELVGIATPIAQNRQGVILLPKHP